MTATFNFFPKISDSNESDDTLVNSGYGVESGGDSNPAPPRIDSGISPQQKDQVKVYFVVGEHKISWSLMVDCFVLIYLDRY